ncbi:YidB family protein [Enterobacter cancerogenus]|uniref:YidB family protein n=1 Tax=Enterobacter cancerogenus TaxID=69218 RepID=UPI00384FE679
MVLSDLINSFSGSHVEGEEHLHAVMSWIEAQGGIPGVIEKLRDSGLGDVVASWISKGNNLPVSVNQIIAVFGTPALQTLADKTGIDLQGVSSLVATLLPGIVDHFSPEGEEQTKTDLLTAGMNLLKSKFFS